MAEDGNHEPAPEQIGSQHGAALAAELGEIASKPVWHIETEATGRGVLKRHEIFVVDNSGNRYPVLRGVRSGLLQHHVEGFQKQIDAGTFELGERMGGSVKR